MYPSSAYTSSPQLPNYHYGQAMKQSHEPSTTSHAHPLGRPASMPSLYHSYPPVIPNSTNIGGYAGGNTNPHPTGLTLDKPGSAWQSQDTFDGWTNNKHPNSNDSASTPTTSNTITPSGYHNANPDIPNTHNDSSSSHHHSGGNLADSPTPTSSPPSSAAPTMLPHAYSSSQHYFVPQTTNASSAATLNPATAPGMNYGHHHHHHHHPLPHQHPPSHASGYPPMSYPYGLNHMAGHSPRHAGLVPRPKLTTTLWEDEGTICYQVDANGICVARRQDNDMINGTKLLNVAGMSRGKRDGILKNEKGRVVVKVGAMHLKGVWITFDRAKALAIQYKIQDILYPLFVDEPTVFLYTPLHNTIAGNRMNGISSTFRQQQGTYQSPFHPGTPWERNSSTMTDVMPPPNPHQEHGFRSADYSHSQSAHGPVSSSVMNDEMYMLSSQNEYRSSTGVGSSAGGMVGASYGNVPNYPPTYPGGTEKMGPSSGNAASPATNSVAATIGGVGNNHGGHSDSHPMMSIHSNGASIPAGLPAPPLSAHGTSQSSVRNLYFGEEVLETNNKVKPELGGEKQNNETSEPFYGHSPEQGVKQPGLKMMPLHSSAFHSVTGSPMTPNAREGPYFPPSMEMDNAASSDTSTTTTTTTNSSILSSPSTGRRGSLLMGVPSRISSPRHHPYIPQEKVYSSGIMSTLQGYRGSDSSSYNNAAQQSQKDAIASHERRDACSLPETGDLLNRHPW